MKTLLTVETTSKDEWDATIQEPTGRLDLTVENPAEYFPFTNRSLCPPLGRKPKPITVLLAEDRTIIRQGICAVLSLEEDIRVIGEASDGPQAAELTERLHPDVVVISAAIACLNRMQATRRILHAHPAPRVFILARHADDTYARHAVALGAAGYLTEQVSAQMLARTLRLPGSYGFGRGNSRSLPENPGPHRTMPASREPTGPLTSRQRQVLQLIAEGSSNKQMASDLSISIKTVEKHRQYLMAKLGIHETAGLTRYAISAEIIKCGSKTRLAKIVPT
jgi:DNA-binding NarL/FixJ family response regulator